MMKPSAILRINLKTRQIISLLNRTLPLQPNGECYRMERNSFIEQLWVQSTI